MKLIIWVERQINHLTVMMVKSRTDAITLTVIIGIISQLALFSYDYNYYTHYTVGFLRSFLFLVLCYFAVRNTHSIRLLILMIIVLCDMSMDLAAIVSTEYYWLTRPFRHTGIAEFYNININFRDLYSAYEILCLVHHLSGGIYLYFSNSNSSNTGRNSAFRYLFDRKGNSPRSKA